MSTEAPNPDTLQILPSRPTPWGLILPLVAIVLIPLAIWEWPREQRRWKVARAVQLRLDGNKDEALTIIDGVIEDDPQNIAVRLLRASWQLQDEDGDRALADVQKACELRPDSGTLVYCRSQMALAVGKYDEAIRDADEVLKHIGPAQTMARAHFLNYSAYTRGLAQKDLTTALRDANDAIGLSRSQPTTLLYELFLWLGLVSRDEDSPMALHDTRGYILWRMEQYPEALTDLNLALEVVQKKVRARERQEADETRPADHTDFETRSFYRNAAVIYYHRGLIYQSLGKDDLAKKDFEQVKEWGFEPGDDLY